MDTAVAQRIARRFITLPLEKRRLYLQKMLEENVSPANLPIAPVSAEFDTLSLSFAQERQWFLWQLDPESAAYHMPTALRLRGPLDIAALEQSFTALVARHESLRTTFQTQGEQVVQQVHAAAPVRLQADTLEQRPDETQLRQLIEAETRQLFDLQQGPLLRTRLLRLAADDHVLIVTLHHIVADGWSMQVMVEELVNGYAAFSQGHVPELPALPIQYADYAIWQRHWMEAGERERQLEYWTARLGGQQPVLELPTDFPRPAVMSYRGARLELAIDAVLAGDLKHMAQREGVSLFMLLLASFQALLHRYSGQHDIRVGVPTANRNRVETERLIGFFVNTQVLDSDVQSQDSFGALLQQVKQAALGAQAHQELPFEQLVEALQPERNLSHSPLFQVMFNHRTQGPAGEGPVGALKVEGLRWDSHTAQFDLTLETVEHSEGLSAGLIYATDLFGAETIARMAGHWQNLLRAIVADPTQRIGELPLLDAAERQAQLDDGQRNAAPAPEAGFVHQLFERQAARTPDAPALVIDDERWSYGQLNARANQLAGKLQSLGVGPDVLVGIAVERSAHMLVGLLAILKAGGAYLPLDPAFPQDRLAYMIEDSGIELLLTQNSLLNRFSAPCGSEPVGATLARDGGSSVNGDGGCADAIASKLCSHRFAPTGAGVGITTLVLDQEGDWLDGYACEAPATHLDAEHLAYAIYTSGSTGKPKGVMVRHGALTNFVASMAKAPGMTAQDRALSLTTFSFDIFGLEIYVPLMVGACIVLTGQHIAQDPYAVLALIAAEQVNVVQATPSTWRMLLDNEHAQGLRGCKCLCGGEALPRELAVRMLALGGEVWNLYGPTETTIWSALHPLQTQAAQPWLGGPIDNTTLYIVGADLMPVPYGVAGELLIGGQGLARGYFQRPALTAERFVPHPFVAGERLYRTGDLARQRADGILEYLGRIDHQVKIRGFRIELGEIEARLLEQGSVREAAVLAQDAPGGQALVAYIVPTAELDDLDATAQSDLRDSLTAGLKVNLPDYMVPAHVVLLPRFPLTPNGKLDRKQLPKPDASQWQKTYVAPQTSVQQAVATIWADILKVRRVGLDDNFFELGGHSLLATQVMSRIRQQLNVQVPLRLLFAHNSLRAFVEALGTASANDEPSIPRIPRDQPLALSFAQQRQWFLWQLEPTSSAYHIPAALRLRGALDRAALQQSFDALVARHESLRTRFVLDNERPLQVIDAPAPLTLAVESVDAGIDEQALRGLIEAETRRLFDLQRGPLLRVKLLQLGADEHVLILTQHHIVSDAWSMQIMVDDLLQLYAGFSQGQPVALAPLPIQYADYGHWQRQWLAAGEQQRQLDYWLEQLGGEQPILELPTDHPRPAQQSYRGARLPIVIEPALAEGLKRLAQQHNSTLFMLLLAGFQTLLHRYSGQDDIRVGVPIANRNREETERLLGFFVNTQVLKADIDGNLRFDQLLDQVKQRALGAQAHQDLPFEQLVERLEPARNLSHTPLFQVMFNHASEARRDLSALPGLSLEQLTWDSGTAQFDLTLDTFEYADGLSAALTYARDLFEPGTIARLGEHWLNLLRAIVAHPAQRIAELPMLDGAQRRVIVEDWNRTYADYPNHVPVHQLIEAQVERDPHAEALVFEGQSLSYAQLNARANQLAHALIARGIGPDVLVGIAVQRSVEMVVGLLAILKAGGAYVPLDPEYPTERLAYMIEDSGIELLLTQSSLLNQLPLSCGSELARDGGGPVNSDVEGEGHIASKLAPTGGGVTPLVLDGDDAWLRDYPTDNPPSRVVAENLAYVIYTSGSTGKPKGAGNSHGALTNRLCWMQQAYGLEAGDSVLQKTPFSFDVSVWEFFWPLMTGVRLVVAAPGDHRDPQKLVSLIERESITTLHFVPSMLQAFVLDANVSRCTSLTRIVCSGEALPVDAQQQVFAKLPDARLYNLYGPTEAAIDVTHWTCRDEGRDAVPIGEPIANLMTYILDDELNPVPSGVNGELYLSGQGLARGYHRRPELTAERFVASPFVAGERLYRTGDLARYRPNGVIDYIGRIDHQVKVRGFRIELGEIEARLLEHAAVREAVVVAQDSRSGKVLSGYVVVQAEATGDWSLLREALLVHLRLNLPEHMVPTHLTRLEHMPLSPNGKLDRKALPAPESPAFAHRSYEATTGEIEDTLARIWCELLGMERVGRDDDFFELGGHSLLAVRLVSQLRERLGVELPLPVLFTHPRLADLAREVAEASQNTLGAIARADRCAPLPMSFAQQRLWFIARVDPEASKAYHVPDAVRLRGPLDRAALQAAFDRIVERHEVLRTRFVGMAGEARQVIDAPRGFALLHEDRRGIDDEALERIVREEALRPFDLALGPLIRGRLLALGPDDHALLVTMHHIVSDGWSGGVLAKEFSALYGAFREGRPDPLPPLAIQYADFGMWQRQWLQGPLLQQQLQQWVRQLRGAPALLDLPTDRPRPPVQDYRGANIAVELDAALGQGLRALGQRHGTTLYMTLLAAWAVVLGRLAGQEQVVIGSSHAGRNRVEVEPLIGFFVNTQALKIDISGGPSVGALLAQARQTAVQAQSLQDVPFERLVEALNPPRSLAHHPVFQVMLSWHNTPGAALDLPGLQAQSLGGGADSAQFELSLELRENGEGIAGQLNYASALFDEATVRRHWRCLEAVLRAMVADDGQPVDRIDLLDADERAAIVEGFNESHAAVAEPVLVHALIEQQAARQPDAQAIEYAGESLGYGELNARANRLAHHLRALGVKPDDRVAICAERSLELVVAMLATLKAGGAYVPLDPVHPDERLAQMLEDSGAAVLLTQRRLDARLQAPQRCARVLLDAELPKWASAPSANPDPAAVGLTPSHLAYVIYTSGSTGEPKGVMVEHRNVAFFLRAMEACVHGTAPDCRRVAWNSSFGFDMAVKAWGQLAFGRSVFLLPETDRLGAHELLGFLETHRIEAMECTPSHLRLLQGAGLLQGRAPSLRKLLLGGEAIDAATWGALAAVDDRLFFNMYGPTECSVDASCGVIDGRRPHIGQVMPGARIYVLDAAGQPVPVGVAGEIHIGGAGVARGYLGRPELTAQRFLRDPFVAEDAPARMYRTGDLGRWRDDGTLEYLGRNDQQIKLRGFRIEPGEIEARLTRLPGVRDAAVVAREDVPGDRRLVAYVVAGAEAPDPALLRAGLAAQLPEYMLPSAFVTLDALPLTPNGKLDRKALPAPDVQGLALGRYEPPQGEAERAIAALWSELLGIERIGRHDNFFDLGGYSLMVFQVIEGLKRKGYEVALQDVLLAQQLSALAALIGKPREDVADGNAGANAQWVTIRKGGGTRRALVFVHEPSGEVLSYERLARHVDPEIGLYGIRADRAAVHGESRYEDLAAGYARLIRKALPQGPYRLAGWSAGGVLAFEVARQLIAAGGQVEFLGLIDSWHRGEGERGVSELGEQDRKLLLVAFAEYYGRKLEASEIERILAADGLPAAIALARAEGWLKKDMSPAEFDARAELWFDLRAAAHRYHARPLEVDAHLFSALPGDAGDPANGWSAVLGNRLQVHHVGGDHWSIMMDAGHAARVGGAIDSLLARLDGAQAKPAMTMASRQPAPGAVVTIRSGSGAQARKVFCLPGAGANATTFLDFASRSPGDASFIGLEAPALLGREGEPPTLQEAARRHVDAIRALRPQGPYHLIGHSFGGWVALEAARQLAGAGATVAPVVLVDTDAPRAEGFGDRAHALREYLALIRLQGGKEHGLDAGTLAALPAGEQTASVFEAMRRARLLPPSARRADFAPVLEMFCRQCAIGYRPESEFTGLALLLRAVSGDGTEAVGLDAWRRHEPRLRSFDVPGSDHLSILRPPHVDRVIGIVGRHWYLGQRP